MLTRRSLFARLSAIAVAPLVKWLPKGQEPEWAISGHAEIKAPEPVYAGRILDSHLIPDGVCVTTSDGAWLCDKNGNWWPMSPVPQEEA